eukprot:4362391-Lingulodinium_polyedra.AAC.1
MSSSRARVAQKRVRKIHSIIAARRMSQRAHSMRRPPRGGQCMECANSEMRCAQQWHAFLSACLSSSRARAAQTC